LGLGALGTLSIFVWIRTHHGFALDLWGQDVSFCTELGLSRTALVASSGIMVGLATALIGSYNAFSNGSTPEGGLMVFLYGAGAALLLPSVRVSSSFWGGLLLGTSYAAIQLKLSPSVANLALFAAILIILVVRGTSRSSQRLR
jgi:hypothetical protein